MSDRSTADGHGGGSLARAPGATQRIVLPGVKMDLAVVVLVLGCLWWLVAAAEMSRPGEALALLGGSLVACGWLVWRTRRALARASARSAHGPE